MSTTGSSTEVDQERLWSDLPLDLIDEVASRLTFMSRIWFGGVCKSWSSTRVPPQRWPFKHWPLLMYLPKDFRGDWKLFNPIVGDVIFGDHVLVEIDDDVDVPFSHLELRFSKDGWVLITEDVSVYMISLFTEEETMELPELALAGFCNGFSFSSPPTSTDCVVFAISRSGEGGDYDLYFLRPGEEDSDWTEVSKRYDEAPFLVADNNPVFHRGLFYCLGKKGNLGVFDPKTEEWTVLQDPKPNQQFCLPQEKRMAKMDMKRYLDRRRREQCYLVESSKGELLAVFDYNYRKPFLVMKLVTKKSKMAWTKVEDLEDETIFVDKRSSISIAAPLRGIGNRIYYSRYFCDDDDDGNPREAAYYSLKTKKYYFNPEYQQGEKTNCVWIMAPQFSS